METTILYVVYAICILLHRFYMRYITYSLFLFFSADASVMRDFNREVKNKGYSGHSLRVAQWEYFKKSGDSQFSYLLGSLINPFIFGMVYLIFFYVIYELIF